MISSYQVDVENFGPIAKARVDVRPLTVFVGPSNTGKSYLAVLLYALHQCLGGAAAPYGGRFPPVRNWSFDVAASESRPFEPAIRKGLKQWASKLSTTESFPALPADVAMLIRSVLLRPRGLESQIANELSRCFGVDGLDALLRRPHSGVHASIRLKFPPPAGPEEFRYDFEFGQGEPRLSGHIPLLESFPFEDEWRKSPIHPAMFRELDDEDNDTLEWLVASLTGVHFRSMLGPLGRNAYYLPADRTGVMHSHQVVVSTLVQSAATAGLRPSTNIPMLSGVLADFLNHLIGISGARGRRTRKTDPVLAAHIERNLIEGAVRMERNETGYPSFAYRPKGWKIDLPLMRASSMVSELAPVVLYLRHLVRAGDVLIIEEPESHLHPAMQAAFARELARLVGAGIRVVMTTHSEWFLEQIGNLVRLSTLSEKKRDGIEGADVALHSDDVGAWLFKPSEEHKGSVVEEVVLDPDTGLYSTDYDAVSEALYNDSAAIFNRQQDGDA